MARKEIRKKLEELGEPKVKQMLAAGHRILGDVDSPYQYEVLLWLVEKAEVRLDAQSDETISVARKANTIALAAAVSASDANDIARSAKKFTLIAAIAAIVAAIAAIKWW